MAFLDVLVKTYANSALEIRLYRKEIHAEQLVNFCGNHPNNERHSCIEILSLKAKAQCSAEELGKRKEAYLLKMIEKNGYPRHFVRTAMHAMK